MECLVPGAPFGGSAAADIPKPLAYGLDAPIRTKIGNTSAGGNAGIGFTAQDINGLLSGSAWDTHSITYSFPTSAANYGSGYGNREPLKGFHALTGAQQGVVRYALNLISQYTLLTFTQITESNTKHAMIRFGDSAVPPTSWTYLPSATKEGGDVWFGNIANVVPTIPSISMPVSEPTPSPISQQPAAATTSSTSPPRCSPPILRSPAIWPRSARRW
jgi:hypothetical protein